MCSRAIQSGLTVLALLTLASCAPRGPLTLVPEAAEIASVHTIFTATTRSQAGVGTPGSERMETPQYSKLNIAVPPNRTPGTITFPRGTPDPDTDFLVTASTSFDSARAFRRDLARALAATPANDREVILYVHGFNNTFAEGVLRIAQLNHDIELPGVAVHYSWPSLGNPLGYAYDRDSALFARDGLEQLITEIRRAGPRRITIVAHSMGALLTMETLRQMSIARPDSVSRDIDAIVMLSPDIDIDLFRAQARRIGKLPEDFVIFTSDRDRALRLSARLTGQRERLGNITNPVEVADLTVTLIDVTAFSSGVGHFVAGSSPALIQIFRGIPSVDDAFRRDPAGRSGFFPGTVLTIQNVTEIILSPNAALSR
ncbi:MAG: alpha/beta fold hydrolase [Pseudomonadota bacterium]